MNGTDWVILGVIVALFLFSGVLAMAETAFVRMSRIRALAMAEEGHRAGIRLARMLEKPENTLNPLLLVIMICQLTSSTLFGVLIGEGNLLLVLTGVVVEITVFFVFAEVAPKTFAIQHPERAAVLTSGVMWFFTTFWPLRVIGKALITVANVVLPGRGLKEGPFVTEEEIRTMADVAADEEAIEREEQELIHSIFEFGDTIVREVMTPRTDMVSLPADVTVDEALAMAIEGGFSRLPAFDGSTDNIVGLVYMKDLVLASTARRGGESVRSSLREAEFVPEQKRVAELLREMQQKKFHMAVVFDEYGGTAGIVTLEDLLEEIVGEIVDEYDPEQPTLERLPDGTLRAPGRTPIDEVNELLDVELPHEEWDTVGGLVFSVLGRAPEQMESVSFQGFDFLAERVQGRRIVSVLITARPDVEAERAALTGSDDATSDPQS